MYNKGVRESSARRALGQLNGPNCAITRYRAPHQKTLKRVATFSVQGSELEVMYICRSVMSRHQTHGLQGYGA